MKNEEREILPIQKSVLRLMTYLLGKDSADETIMDYLREVELEYFSLLDKLQKGDMGDLLERLKEAETRQKKLEKQLAALQEQAEKGS